MNTILLSKTKTTLTAQHCLRTSWELKENGLKPEVRWSIVKEINSYNNPKTCRLCLYQKYAILNYPSQNDLLNKRSELVSKCRHQNKFLLANYKSKD